MLFVKLFKILRNPFLLIGCFVGGFFFSEYYRNQSSKPIDKNIELEEFNHSKKKRLIVFICKDFSSIEKYNFILTEPNLDIYFILEPQEKYSCWQKILLNSGRCGFVENISDYDDLVNSINSFNLLEIDNIIILDEKEKDAMLFAKIRDEFNIRNGLRFDKAQYFLDKKQMMEILKKNGITTIPFKYFNEELSINQPYPFVLKDRNESGARGIYIIRDEEDLEEALFNIDEDLLCDYVIEPYVDGVDYLVNCLVVNGKLKFVYSSFYLGRLFDFYRKGKPLAILNAPLDESKKLEALAKNVISALVVKNGVISISCIKNKSADFLVSDISPTMKGEALDLLILGSDLSDFNSEVIKTQLGSSLLDSSFSKKEESEWMGILILPFPNREMIEFSVEESRYLYGIESFKKEHFFNEIESYNDFSRNYIYNNEFPKKDDLFMVDAQLYFIFKNSDLKRLEKDLIYAKDNISLKVK